jgi:hypothetical protein
MNNESWEEQLQMLMVRHSHLGIGASLDGVSMTERWGMFCFLSRMENKYQIQPVGDRLSIGNSLCAYEGDYYGQD